MPSFTLSSLSTAKSLLNNLGLINLLFGDPSRTNGFQSFQGLFKNINQRQTTNQEICDYRISYLSSYYLESTVSFIIFLTFNLSMIFSLELARGFQVRAISRKKMASKTVTWSNSYIFALSSKLDKQHLSFYFIRLSSNQSISYFYVWRQNFRHLGRSNWT